MAKKVNFTQSHFQATASIGYVRHLRQKINYFGPIGAFQEGHKNNYFSGVNALHRGMK